MITIAIPFYNAEKYFELAIKSVLNQTYSDWKLILVDDGSTDNSIKIAKKYENLDKRIKVYSDGKNKNLAYRLNEIAKLADTKYLARMDADDIMHPQRIEKQLYILETYPEIDVLGTNAFSIDENNVILGMRVKSNLNNPELLNTKSFIHPSIMAKTEWFRSNPYDTEVIRAQDYELWQRTASNSNFKVYTEPLLFYREFGVNYYKKYFKGISSVFYVANKHKTFKGYLIAFTYLLKAVLYFIFNKIKLEHKLIENRNVELQSELLNKSSLVLKNIIYNERKTL